MTKQLTRKDIDMIREWYIVKNIPLSAPDVLPKIGFLCDDAAAAFLVQTDTSSAFIELVGNPTIDPEKRDVALDVVVQCCIEAAKELGFKHLLGFTTLPRVVERAEKLGFSVGASYTLLSIDLSKE